MAMRKLKKFVPTKFKAKKLSGTADSTAQTIWLPTERKEKYSWDAATADLMRIRGLPISRMKQTVKDIVEDVTGY